MKPSTALQGLPGPELHPGPAAEMLGLLLLVTGTPELTKESYVALERMALSVSVLNGASSGSSLGVPSHGHLMKVWQVALRKNTKSGSSMWPLCRGGWQLQTKTELLSAHSPCAAMRAASPHVSGGFKEKGQFYSLHLSLVTTVSKEPPPRGWFGSELVSSLAVSAFWSGKLACLLTPTAGTFSL